ncbi:MAG: PAS domain S-box protein [Candidatus Pacebacteria bacterium]|nr:PAS domain S-box protein [Candidatus Paceibacterota bacterium]
MKKITFPVSRTKAVWELLFELTFVSPSPDWWAILCLLASKLVSFSQPLMLIYYGTSCSSWSDLASYFTPMACPVGEGEFFISCYAFFGLVQFFVGLLLFKFFDIWGRLRKNGCSSEYSFLSLSLHAFLLFSTRVLTHVGISAFSYSVFQVLNPGTGFDGYKHLTTWTEVTAQSYVAIALTLVGTLEVLCAAGLFTILCQDRSVRGTSFWSANTFYHALTELCFTMVIQIEFFFNSSVRLSYIIRVLMRGTVFLALALYTRYSHYLVDMTEFFFAVLELELNAFVLAFDLLDYTFNDYVSYPIMMIPFALFVCIIRSYSSWQVRPESPKNEAAVMDSVERLLSLAKNKDYRSITTLTGLLVMHSQRCQTEGCDCKNLMQKLISPGNSTRGLAADPPMSENTVVYLTDVNVPEAVTKGMVKETLTILIGELASHVAKGEELETQMAEVAFYYFRNHYTALKQIAQVEAGKPRLTIRQRLYNLKRTISTGFERWAEEEDPEKTLLAIRYLKYYHKFLDRVEDATEATIKFWSIVTEDAPSSNRLNELGKILFDCKFKTTKTVERLSQIASNNVEFLVRYGLFLRLVMHDLVISEQVFQKIVSLHIAMESNAADKLAQGLFSVFRFEASIMLVLAKLEHTGTATVAEINTHVEQVLGYTRRDLIGCSVTNLMPAPIAQKHESYVSKFYKTMKTTNINVHRARYVKTKDGMYVMCRCLTKIVPKLDEKIMLAVFMVPDKRCSYYTTFRREITGKKTGSVLFVPGSYTVMGFTREAMSLLRVSEEHLRELMDTITLFDMFPWTQRPEFLEKLFTNEGKVIEYHHSHAMSLNKETDGGTNSEQASRTFFWIRLVVEKVNNSPVFVAMVISEIPKAANANYELEPGSNVFFFDSRAKVTQTQAPKHERNIMESKKDASSHRPAWAIISDVASVASMASVATSTQTGSMKTEGGYELSRELQMAGESTQTPTAIKWLCVGMFVMLLVVVGLIIVNAYVALQEISSLATRFDLIQAYHLRYRGTMLVTDMARIYSQFLIGGNLTVLNKYTRIRNGYLCDYNVATRKLLFNQKLDYDDEIVTTVDMDYYQMNASFSHAVFIVCFLSR